MVGLMTESEFSHHEACDNCGSSDANSVYSDGHKFCFVCHTYTPSEGEVHSHKMATDVHYKGSAERLQKRNISEKLVNSLGFSEMETRYASHILQGMEFFKDSN